MRKDPPTFDEQCPEPSKGHIEAYNFHRRQREQRQRCVEPVETYKPNIFRVLRMESTQFTAPLGNRLSNE